ncbi:MAG TPA: hypothetical protein VGL37_04170 [Solirubrobacteraceae bacterium]
MRIGLALAVGLLLIALAMAITLLHAPLVVARDNSAVTHTPLVTTTGPAETCQAAETLPSGTTALRFGLTTALGPQVKVLAFSDSHLITQGLRPPGWEGASVTVPVRAVPSRTSIPVKICLRMSMLNGAVTMLGWHTHRAPATGGSGKPLPGRMHIEYLRPARGSWWSMAGATARRLGLGRPASGTWNAFLVMGLAVTLIALSSWLVVRELR